jgi:hypothetical protein
MGSYYGVEQITKLGTKIASYSSTPPEPQGNQALVAVMDNGVFRVAVDVSRPSEYAHFKDAYSQGMWLSMDVYTISKDKLAECPDTRRASSTISRQR